MQYNQRLNHFEKIDIMMLKREEDIRCDAAETYSESLLS